MTTGRIKPLLFLSAILVISGLACATLIGSSAEISPILIPPSTSNSTVPTISPSPEPTTQSSEAVTSSQPTDDRFFTEDFDEPLAKWSYILTSGHEDQFSLNVKNGYLVFDETGKNIWAYSIYDKFIYTDVRLDVRVENLGSSINQINLVCRYDEHEGWWEFVVQNGLYEMRFGKWDDNKKTASYFRIANGGSKFWKYGQAVNDIQASCADAELKLSINGHEAGRAKDDQHFLLRGQIGVGVSSFEDPDVHVRYDWIKISER